MQSTQLLDSTTSVAPQRNRYFLDYAPERPLSARIYMQMTANKKSDYYIISQIQSTQESAYKWPCGRERENPNANFRNSQFFFCCLLLRLECKTKCIPINMTKQAVFFAFLSHCFPSVGRQAANAISIKREFMNTKSALLKQLYLSRAHSARVSIQMRCNWLIFLFVLAFAACCVDLIIERVLRNGEEKCGQI